jgi:hypothetical protein
MQPVLESLIERYAHMREEHYYSTRGSDTLGSAASSTANISSQTRIQLLATEWSCSVRGMSSEQGTPPPLRPASLLLVDRTLDLLSPSGVGGVSCGLEHRILNALPRRKGKYSNQSNGDASGLEEFPLSEVHSSTPLLSPSSLSSSDKEAVFSSTTSSSVHEASTYSILSYDTRIEREREVMSMLQVSGAGVGEVVPLLMSYLENGEEGDVLFTVLQIIRVLSITGRGLNDHSIDDDINSDENKDDEDNMEAAMGTANETAGHISMLISSLAQYTLHTASLRVRKKH